MTYTQIEITHFRLIVLISDGRSNGGDPRPIAERLKVRGVTLFCVGVADINEEELYNIASSPDHVYILRNFDKIVELNKKLRQGKKSIIFGQSCKLYISVNDY